MNTRFLASLALMLFALPILPLPILPLPILSLTPAVARADAEIDKQAPAFTLPGADGKQYSLEQFKGKTVVLEWLNHDCPFVKKHYAAPHLNMQKLQQEATARGVVWLSINSSARDRQGFLTAEAAQTLTRTKEAHPSAVLLDHDGTTGKAYGARTTPHLFIIDRDGIVRYMGAIDDIVSTDPADIANAKNYVSQALKELETGAKVSEPVTEAYGCSVKYAL